MLKNERRKREKYNLILNEFFLSQLPSVEIIPFGTDDLFNKFGNKSFTWKYSEIELIEIALDFFFLILFFLLSVILAY